MKANGYLEKKCIAGDVATDAGVQFSSLFMGASFLFTRNLI